MKYRDFYKTINKPYFSLADIRLRSLPVNSLQLHQWTAKQELIRLKKGLYVFSDRQSEVEPSKIANILYQPSYVSLESAMFFYNFIPDVIMSTTSITTKTTRNFSNQFGHFIYRSLQPNLFFGYNVLSTKYGKILIAEPEKALLDYLYLTSGKINNQNDIVELRLNEEMLQEKIRLGILYQYLTIFQSKKVSRLVQLIIKSCSLSNN
ncbi:MAG: type IV toxin-antitoxin system AbiEi family antitoxin domain-containing protein [Patescibacteria group bacterium]